eukprot:TRINITY_DN44052_c0_g1_i1.p1 TRINITY_DN44052_c0_g1~~TRINITY_DN44052_c0_g1_i1.p1  ORF type:complete len:523 (+),score=185.78 TRINITY_DN44052_c0_g1_i1:50-1618(+)
MEGAGEGSAEQLPLAQQRRVRHQLDQCLGRGAFGTVFLGLDEDTGEQVAVKQIIFGGDGRGMRQRLEQIINEITVMQKLSHPNVVRYFGAKRESSTLWIYMEYVSGGTLTSLIRRFGGLPSALTHKFLRHILEGLRYLHSLHLCHRDIKGDNVLLRPSGEAMLCDFGTAKQIEDCLSLCGCLETVCGTPNYMAPEVLTGEKYGLPADVWSVGCTLFEMLTGKRPYSEFAHPHAAMFHLALTGKPPSLPESIDNPLAQGVLERCFVREPRMRASAEELLSHPFVDGAVTAAGVSPNRRRPASSPAPRSCTPRSSCPPSPTAATPDPGNGAGDDAQTVILPHCDLCRKDLAVWACCECPAEAPLRLCPHCWDSIHDGDAEEQAVPHRKAPMLFGRLTARQRDHVRMRRCDVAPETLPLGASPTCGAPLADLSPHRDLEGAVELDSPGWAATQPVRGRGIVLEDGHLVDMLTIDDIPPGQPTSMLSPATSADSPSTAQQWHCPKCTYLNHPLLPTCEMCGCDRSD